MFENKTAFANTPNQSIILVKLNQDTVMEVPEPMYIYNNSSVKQKYQINLKSSSDPIDAFLLQQKSSSESIKVPFSFGGVSSFFLFT